MTNGLTEKQRQFVNFYVQSWNAADAARRAGYSEKTANQSGFQNTRNPKIQAEIAARLADNAMGAEEALSRLAAQARASIEDFIEFKEGIREPYLNLKKAKEAGKLGIVKSFKYDTNGRLQIELHDAQAALALIAKHHGLLTERYQVEGQIELNAADELHRRLSGIAARRRATEDTKGDSA